MPKCGEVMTRDVVSCVPFDSVAQAADMMRRHDVGSLPVVDSPETRRLVGIVTDRDLVTKIVAGGRPVERSTVADAMTSSPVTCREDDDVERAVSLMSEHRVRRMPIVSQDGRLAGIIAQADIATRLNRDGSTGDLVEAISEPSGT